jgi:hypothetical protein
MDIDEIDNLMRLIWITPWVAVESDWQFKVPTLQEITQNNNVFLMHLSKYDLDQEL